MKYNVLETLHSLYLFYSISLMSHHTHQQTSTHPPPPIHFPPLVPTTHLSRALQSTHTRLPAGLPGQPAGRKSIFEEFELLVVAVFSCKVRCSLQVLQPATAQSLWAPTHHNNCLLLFFFTHSFSLFVFVVLVFVCCCCVVGFSARTGCSIFCQGPRQPRLLTSMVDTEVIASGFSFMFIS